MGLRETSTRYTGQGKGGSILSSSSKEGLTRAGYLQQQNRDTGTLIFDSTEDASLVMPSTQPGLWFWKRGIQGSSNY